MERTENSAKLIHAGDLEGLGKVYSEWGGLIIHAGETVIKQAEGWDANVSSPWRRILPNLIFAGFAGPASSNLYITSERIVLIREINVWRELKEELSPLGVPAAAAKEIRLKKLESAGARQFCEIWPGNLRVAKMKRVEKRRSWLDLRLLGPDRRQFEVIIWKTNGLDPEILTIILSRFKS